MTDVESQQTAKVGTVMMLSGLMEVTIKTRKVAADGHAETDSVKVVTEAPKHDVYVLEQEIHGLKQTLEINPAQDYAHLDQRL